MPVTANLTPAAIAIEDYPMAWTPALGGEMEVYITSKRSRLLGVWTATDSAGAGTYEYFATPTDATPGPILAIVETDLRAVATDPVSVTYADITAEFEPPLWARNQTLDFPATRAVELIGTLGAFTSSTVPTVANAKRGTRIALVEMPVLADFKHVGSTNGQKIKIPTRTSKPIGRKLFSAYWNVAGKTEIGTLEVASLDEGVDDGLRRYMGIPSTVMVKAFREGQIVRSHEFFLDWVPSSDMDQPEGDGENKLNATGMFSRMAVLPAPGTAP